MKIKNLICASMIASMPPVAWGQNIEADVAEDEAVETVSEDINEPTDETPKAIAHRSRLSKVLEDKLSITTGFSLGSVKQDGNDWGAFGQGGIGLLWNMRKLRGFQVGLTARYSPSDIRPTIENQAYKGVLEAFYFGSRLSKQNKKMVWFADAEIGLMVPMLQDADGITDPEKKAEAGIDISIGGGLNFPAFKKVTFGPVAHIGFGSFSTMQLGAQAQFSF